MKGAFPQTAVGAVSERTRGCCLRFWRVLPRVCPLSRAGSNSGWRVRCLFNQVSFQYGTVHSILVDPASPDTVYVASWGSGYLGGVFALAKGEDEWIRLGSGLPQRGMLSLAIAGSKLYAGSDGAGAYEYTAARTARARTTLRSARR